MSISLCLIALSLGYLVFNQASQAKEGLKIVGQTIGVIVMATSLLSAVCCMTQTANWKWSGSNAMGGCPISIGSK